MPLGARVGPPLMPPVRLSMAELFGTRDPVPPAAFNPFQFGQDIFEPQHPPSIQDLSAPSLSTDPVSTNTTASKTKPSTAGRRRKSNTGDPSIPFDLSVPHPPPTNPKTPTGRPRPRPIQNKPMTASGRGTKRKYISILYICHTNRLKVKTRKHQTSRPSRSQRVRGAGSVGNRMRPRRRPRQSPNTAVRVSRVRLRSLTRSCWSSAEWS